ncbi:hypothetical protein BGZ94_009720 [Podila epigama]|nr:hypothetical protein BGZ94_009720 [Podila epigama]
MQVIMIPWLSWQKVHTLKASPSLIEAFRQWLAHLTLVPLTNASTTATQVMAFAVGTIAAERQIFVVGEVDAASPTIRTIAPEQTAAAYVLSPLSLSPFVHNDQYPVVQA